MKIYYSLIFLLASLFMFDNAFAQQSNDGIGLNLATLAIIAGFSGIGTLGWGIFQYRQTRYDKRKDLFLELTKEFDSSKDFLPAKKILDGWAISYSAKNGLCVTSHGQFSGYNIDWILAPDFRKRKELEAKYKQNIFHGMSEEDLNQAWGLIRDSFDAMFDFYERLLYLQKNKRITPTEMSYFDYYLDLAKKDKDVFAFLDFYNFSWHRKLKYGQ